MDKVINNELIAYKSGFGDGKLDILKQISSNSDNCMFIKNDSNDIKEAMFVKPVFDVEGWYSYGYDDSYNYYLKWYLENGYISEELITRNHENKIMEYSYANRVIEFNQKNDKEVPIGKFRM